MKKYLRHSFIDPRLYTAKSVINGTGIFTSVPIQKDEIVMVWGGVPIAKKNFDDTKYRFMSLVPINDETYLGLPIEDTHTSIDEYLNHSCDSNCWMKDEVTVIARRDIQKNEEITLDSCLWDSDTEYEYLEEGGCTCGSVHCRKQLTPKDWMRSDVQKRYAGHFSPYIQKKIDLLQNPGK